MTTKATSSIRVIRHVPGGVRRPVLDSRFLVFMSVHEFIRLHMGVKGFYEIVLWFFDSDLPERL